jgi:hypothetical protein
MSWAGYTSFTAGRETMTTWMQVMAVVRALDAKRRGGQPLEGRDAESLVTMLLDFHGRAVEPPTMPDSASPAPRGASGRR